MIEWYHRGRLLYDTVKFHFFWNLKGKKPISDLNHFEKKIYSQNREDGMIEAIFRQIGTTNRFFVEFGTEGEGECCTHNLKRKGWAGLWMDGNPPENSEVHKEFITAENVNRLFTKYEVPHEFDLLAIDIDGNDYHVWKALKYSPRVLVIEYNACFLPNESKVIPYKADFVWDRKSRYCGASISAMNKLAGKKGYTLVAVDNRKVNAFFIRNDLIENNFKISNIKKCFEPSPFGKLVKEGEWVEV